jgi:hypothetical protein
MSIDEQRHALAREVQACDVRLSLLPPFGQEPRNETFREELLQRRHDAASELAALKRLGAGIQPVR